MADILAQKSTAVNNKISYFFTSCCCWFQGPVVFMLAETVTQSLLTLVTPVHFTYDTQIIPVIMGFSNMFSCSLKPPQFL